MRVGVIGLGRMGANIARRLMREPDGQLCETDSPSPERRPVRPSIMQLTEPG